MKNQFVYMKPVPNNLVTEVTPSGSTKMLCVECGWESIVYGLNTSIVQGKFLSHNCRLVSQMISGGDL